MKDMTESYKNDEVKIPKFASLLSDAGFKAVLASPRNKGVLAKLLNLVLPSDRQIAEIENYYDREVNGFTPFSKYSRVDIRCRDTSGRDFIVEMQREMHDFFFERCVWYGSTAYGQNLGVGAEYELLRPVYVIAFLEGRFPHEDESLWDSTNCVSCYQMTEKRTGEVAPETIMCIFVELGRFLKDQTELTGSFDKTCYVFKNSEKWKNDAPSNVLDDEIAAELARACEVENFPPNVKLNYVRNMFTEMDYKAEMKANFKKGEAQKASDAALKFIAAGVPEDTIASCLGLTIEQLHTIAANAQNN